jgi:putative colanic acid biosynthesis glycosyltransferase
VIEKEVLCSREITIISITKNDEDGIRRTVESVQMQDFHRWQLVIVVSSERDSSIEYAQRLSEQFENIHYLIPQSLGIYNAMNYAIEKINPELTWFLNGGDVFKNRSILSNAYSLIEKHKPSILIGGYEVKEKDVPKQYGRSPRRITARTFSLNIRSGNHQAMLFDFSGFKGMRFNTELSLASDFLLVLEILHKKSGFRTAEIFAKIEPNGISSSMIKDVWIEKQNARRRVFGKYSIDAFLGQVWTLAVKGKRVIKRN